MHTIKHYQAPSMTDLEALKTRLGFTGNQMAELAALAGNNQWRKYTGGTAPREMSLHMLFFIAAQLTLCKQDFELVLQTMREIGADTSTETVDSSVD